MTTTTLLDKDEWYGFHMMRFFREEKNARMHCHSGIRNYEGK